ncbi:MAG: hypothetical protein M3Z26_00445 [Bacteroidota bacterium]|nr:hypothetical protein [Bacteroidota bacterium]
MIYTATIFTQSQFNEKLKAGYHILETLETTKTYDVHRVEYINSKLQSGTSLVTVYKTQNA